MLVCAKLVCFHVCLEIVCIFQNVQSDLRCCNAGMSFAYQLLYLLDATGFYSLGLHALGIHVCRATGQELVLDLNRIENLHLCFYQWYSLYINAEIQIFKYSACSYFIVLKKLNK